MYIWATSFVFKEFLPYKFMQFYSKDNASHHRMNLFKGLIALSVMKYFIVRDRMQTSQHNFVLANDRDSPNLTEDNTLEFHVKGFETLFRSF